MARCRVSGIPDICNSNTREVDATAQSRIRCFIMRQHITLLLLFFFFLVGRLLLPLRRHFYLVDPEGWSLRREKCLRVGRRCCNEERGFLVFFARAGKQNGRTEKDRL